MKIEEVLKGISKKYNKKEKIIRIMYAQIKEIGYTIKDFEKLLEDFYL